MVNWQSLEPGEPLGVVALSGPVAPERLQRGLAVLESWGHPLFLAPNLGSSSDYLAGADDERLAGLDRVLNQGARIVFAARGGYGITRIADRLPWDRLREDRVCFVGFSDLTAVNNHLVQSGGAPQVHGPMVGFGLDRPANAERLFSVLRGELVGEPLFRFGSQSVLRHGRVEGPSLAFNLTMLATLTGTPHEPDLEGSVLFLEEVGEPLYRLDRMLTHLRRSGKLRGVKALICGSLHRCKPARDRQRIWRELVLQAVTDDVVVVTDLPFGHGAANMAFPIGVSVGLDTSAGVLSWI